MIGGVFYTSCTAGRYGNAENGTGQVAFKIGGNPVQASLLEDAVRGQMQGPPNPEYEGFQTQQVLTKLIEQGAEDALLEKSGYKPDDATLIKIAQQQFDDQLMQARMQMSSQMKPGATDADFAALIKKQYGKTPDQLKADLITNLKKALADSEQRKGVVDKFAKELLIEDAKSKQKVSDADLEATYSSYEFKRLLVKPEMGAGPVETRLDAAMKDIAKGVPFEKVIDTYTSEKPIGNKKPSDNFVDMPQSQLSTDPNMKPLQALKPGQTSGIVTAPDGKAIYKLYAIKPNLPPDFQKNKEKYRKEYLDRTVGPEIEDQITKMKSSPGLVVPQSPGYKAFYDYVMAKNASSPAMAGGMSMGGTVPPDKLQAIYDEAVKASSAGGFDARIASLARYMANSDMWNDPKADKAKLRPARIDTLEDVLKNYEDVDTRLDLVDLYLDAKQNDKAAAELLTASQNNRDYDETGFRHFGKIRDDLQKMQTAKSISADVVKQINQSQLDWSRERANVEQEKAVAKKEQDAAAAQLKAENAKAEAARLAAAKAKAGQPYRGTATTTGSVTPSVTPTKVGSTPTIGLSKPTSTPPKAGASATSTGATATGATAGAPPKK